MNDTMMDHDYQLLITMPNLIIPEQKKQFQIDEHINFFLQRIRFYCLLLTQRYESIIFPP